MAEKIVNVQVRMVLEGGRVVAKGVGTGIALLESDWTPAMHAAAEELRAQGAELGENQFKYEGRVVEFSQPTLSGLTYHWTYWEAGETVKLDFANPGYRDAAFVELALAWHSRAYTLLPDECREQGKPPRKMRDDEVRGPNGEPLVMTIEHGRVAFGSFGWSPGDEHASRPGNPENDPDQLTRIALFYLTNCPTTGELAMAAARRVRADRWLCPSNCPPGSAVKMGPDESLSLVWVPERMDLSGTADMRVLPFMRIKNVLPEAHSGSPSMAYPESKRVFGHDWTFEPGGVDSEGIPDGPDLYRLHLDPDQEGIEVVTMGGDHHWWIENMPETGDVETALLEIRDAIDTFVGPGQSLRTRAESAEANYRFMVERAANEKLDGYRELGQRAADAENRADMLAAQLSTCNGTGRKTEESDAQGMAVDGQAAQPKETAASVHEESATGATERSQSSASGAPIVGDGADPVVLAGAGAVGGTSGPAPGDVPSEVTRPIGVPASATIWAEVVDGLGRKVGAWFSQLGFHGETNGPFVIMHDPDMRGCPFHWSPDLDGLWQRDTRGASNASAAAQCRQLYERGMKEQTEIKAWAENMAGFVCDESIDTGARAAAVLAAEATHQALAEDLEDYRPSAEELGAAADARCEEAPAPTVQQPSDVPSRRDIIAGMLLAHLLAQPGGRMWTEQAARDAAKATDELIAALDKSGGAP